jgi:putative transposase
MTDRRTPTYSRQSNGICEAFNGTIKRNYIYQSCIENEQEVREMIRAAIVDYNAYAPNSALGMKSPWDFFNL